MQWFKMDAVAIAGDWEEGVWAYVRKTTSDRALIHWTMNAPLPQRGHWAATKLIAEYEVPSLEEVHLAAGPDGTVWVAGRTDEGAQIYHVQQGSVQRETGFTPLLKSCRIKDVAVARNGVAYFATDGVGVLVFDGQQWQSHPINEHLPHLLGSNLKPVNYVLPLADGRLCVCTGEYLLIWNEGR